MNLKLLFIIFIILPVANDSFSEEPTNYAEVWESMNVVARQAYVIGVIDGIAEAYYTTMINLAPEKLSEKPESAEVKKVKEKLFVRYTRSQLREVMTDLYRDPANSYIITVDIFFLARDKIEGKDITLAIREARKRAISTHQLNDGM